MNVAKTADIDYQREADCSRFLYREAEVLDRRQFDDWLALLHPEIDYRVPIRTTRLVKDGDGFSTSAYHLKEDLGTLGIRVARLKTDYAWSENPATRIRRMVSNIRVATSPVADEYNVTSNIAIFCLRGDGTTPIVLTGERQDILVSAPDGWRLKKRLVLLDTTVLAMESLSFFL